LPLAQSGNLTLMTVVLYELRPQRGVYHGHWLRWGIRVFLWDAAQAFFIFHFILLVGAIFVAGSNAFPPGHYTRFGLYYMLIFRVQ
jgi:hypothetical protein